MKNNFFKSVLIVFSLCFTSLILSCKNGGISDEVLYEKVLTVAVNQTMVRGDMFNKSLEKSLLEKIATKLGYELHVDFYGSQLEVCKAIEDDLADIGIGNILLNNSIINNYEVSYVYDVRDLYCVTSRRDFISQREYLNGEHILLSSYLSDSMYSQFVNLFTNRRIDDTVLVDDKKQIVERIAYKSGDKKYYFCYRDVALDIVEDSDNLSLYKMTNLLPDNLIMITKRNNLSILQIINDVILNG